MFSQNDLTGEHSCIMLKILDEEDEDAGKDEAGQGATGKAGKEELWLMAYWKGKLSHSVSPLAYDGNFSLNLMMDFFSTLVKYILKTLINIINCFMMDFIMSSL